MPTKKQMIDTMIDKLAASLIIARAGRKYIEGFNIYISCPICGGMLILDEFGVDHHSLSQPEDDCLGLVEQLEAEYKNLVSGGK